MEMRDGYKRSDVGVIPGDWEVSTLGQVCTFENGDRSSNYPSPGSFRQSGIPFINAGHVSDGKISLSEMNFITQEAFERLGGGKVKAGDILFCLRGSLGKFGVVTDNFGLGAIASSLVIVRPKLLALNLNYLGCYFSSSICSRMIDTWAGGAAQPNLGAKELARFSIPIPASLTEQHAIAQAVSDVDALIAGLEKLIAKKRDLKQAAMQQLLTGQTRLPGFSGEWEVKRLGDVGVCLRGVSYKGDADLFPHDTDTSKRLLRSNNVQESLVVTSDLQYVKADRVREHQILRDGDVLICMANGSKALVGKAGYFDVSDEFEYTFGAFMGAYRGNEQANRRFVFYLFQTNRYRDYIANILAGSSINNLSPSSIESLEFNFPELSEQGAIAQTLNDMDSELISLETRLAKTRELKQGMMQELLTGRTRLV